MRHLVCLLTILIALSSFSAPSGGEEPASFDLRREGRAPGVRNQGTPGPCWAFAALGACESGCLTRGLKSAGEKPDLSEMHLAYFLYKSPEAESAFTLRFPGRWPLRQEGNAFKATAFLSRVGAVRERDLPYTMEGARAASRGRAEDYAPCLRLRDVFYLAPDPEPLPGDVKKRLIREHGAITVSYYSDRGKYHEYARGKGHSYFNNTHGRETNHDVILIGWDDAFPRENFRVMPEKDGAWLARDSWGIFLGGNRGYFWISYEQYLFGGAAFVVEDADGRLRHYGYDDLGWCGGARYPWGANVFQAAGPREKLREIAFYTPENGAGYELRVYDLGEDKPSSPIPSSPIPEGAEPRARMEGVMEFAGYHTVTLPEPVPLEKGRYFSVVLRLSVKSPRPLAVETRVKGYSEGCAVRPGESWFSRDGRKWLDGAALSPAMNLCLKAFTLAR